MNKVARSIIAILLMLPILIAFPINYMYKNAGVSNINISKTAIKTTGSTVMFPIKNDACYDIDVNINGDKFKLKSNTEKSIWTLSQVPIKLTVKIGNKTIEVPITEVSNE